MNESDDILEMIRKGGVYYNISGEHSGEVFSDLVTQIQLPANVSAESLRNGLVEREGLMSTSIGNGIAIPHPRTPLVTNEADQRIYVCFLDKNANFEAMDGKSVFVLFVILSNGSQNHLRILSRLSYLFQQESFRSALKKKPDTSELITTIQNYL